jgi:glycosyltransferase involved in cell wall biosynthesis
MKLQRFVKQQRLSSSSIDSKTPLVSIITVCRNSEKTIARTIESVLFQSYSHIEYIIIDGASEDKTIEIIKQYEPNFKGRLRYISEKDAGIYDAMNKGINCTRGKIVGILNSDDWYEQYTIRLVVDAYKLTKDAVYYGVLRVIEDGREVMLKAVSPQFLYREVVGHPAYFIAKSLYNRYGVFRLDYKLAADYDLIMRFVYHKVPFIQINNVLANFVHGGESTKSVFLAMKEWSRIRYQYGYLTYKGMWLQIIKNRIGVLLQRWSRWI